MVRYQLILAKIFRFYSVALEYYEWLDYVDQLESNDITRDPFY